MQYYQVAVSDCEGEAVVAGTSSIAVHARADPTGHTDARKVAAPPAVHQQYSATLANDSEVYAPKQCDPVLVGQSVGQCVNLERGTTEM